MRLASLSMAAFLAASAAQAQPAPADTQKLVTQITLWMKLATLGALPAAGLPVAATPDADGAHIAVPLGEPGKITPPGAAFTATATATSPALWTITSPRLPDTISLQTTEQVPDSPDAKNPKPAGHHEVPVTYTYSLSGQDGHGSVATDGQAPSTLSGTIGQVRMSKQGGAATTDSSIAQVVYSLTSAPSGPGLADVSQTLNTGDYSAATDIGAGTRITLKASSVQVNGTLARLDTAKALTLLDKLPALKAFASRLPENDTSPTPAERAQLHAALETARNALGGLSIAESADGFSMEFGSTQIAARHAALTLGASAPQDTLSGDASLVLDGIAVPALDPALAAYLPSHIAIHPVFANLDLAAVTRQALAITAPGQPGVAAQPNPQLLFGKGGIDIGFSQLDLAVAGAQLTGTGKFNVANPSTVAGTAEFHATGLDPLIAKMQQDPAMTQVLPVIIFLKGIAHMQGDQAVWQVTVHNTKILVNGIDLSALSGGLK